MAYFKLTTGAKAILLNDVHHPVGPSRSCAEFLVGCAAANAADPAITKVTLPTIIVVGFANNIPR